MKTENPALHFLVTRLDCVSCACSLMSLHIQIICTIIIIIIRFLTEIGAKVVLMEPLQLGLVLAARQEWWRLR